MPEFKGICALRDSPVSILAPTDYVHWRIEPELSDLLVSFELHARELRDGC
ncbi:MAG TPA: hypothetical protein VMF03_22245 [Steroidobacteraceae bacterium]|nr:hypothetical protein [Steroidobacteraceae bacterium]